MELRNNESIFGKAHNAITHNPYWELVCNECDIFNGEYNLVFQPSGSHEYAFHSNIHLHNQNIYCTFAAYGIHKGCKIKFSSNETEVEIEPKYGK